MNLNKAIVVGRATNAPEFKTTPNGNNVANFSVATNRNWKDQSGQKQEQVEFHNIVAWGRLAEIINQYLTKGQICMVEGRLQTRSWDDPNGGGKKYRTEIIAENFQLGPRSGQAGGGSYEAAPQDAGMPSEQAPAPAAPKSENGEEDIKVEDIPF